MFLDFKHFQMSLDLNLGWNKKVQKQGRLKRFIKNLTTQRYTQKIWKFFKSIYFEKDLASTFLNQNKFILIWKFQKKLFHYF